MTGLINLNAVDCCNCLNEVLPENGSFCHECSARISNWIKKEYTFLIHSSKSIREVNSLIDEWRIKLDNDHPGALKIFEMLLDQREAMYWCREQIEKCQRDLSHLLKRGM